MQTIDHIALTLVIALCSKEGVRLTSACFLTVHTNRQTDRTLTIQYTC